MELAPETSDVTNFVLSQVASTKGDDWWWGTGIDLLKENGLFTLHGNMHFERKFFHRLVNVENICKKYPITSKNINSSFDCS